MERRTESTALGGALKGRLGGGQARAGVALSAIILRFRARMQAEMPPSLHTLLASRHFLLADGATGTNLFAMGLTSGDAPEPWNVVHPDRVATLHRHFVHAGADIILTNSFGANRYRLALHGLDDRVGELNEAAAQVARRVADEAGRPVLVAGSMGPTGELFHPLGAVSHQQGVAAFSEQAQALARGGVDVLWVETMSSQEELEAALAGADTTPVPAVCTLSFDTNGRTMMGITPAEFAHYCAHRSPAPAAFGTNCGQGAAEAVAGLVSIARVARPGDVLVAKANCGIPEFVDGEIRYDGTPQLMADYACLALDAGARIIGGCCGTTPAHVETMRRALDAHQRRGPPSLGRVVETLGEVSAGASALAEVDAGSLPGPCTPRAGGRGRRTRRARGRP